MTERWVQKELRYMPVAPSEQPVLAEYSANDLYNAAHIMDARIRGQQEKITQTRKPDELAELYKPQKVNQLSQAEIFQMLDRNRDKYLETLAENARRNRLPEDKDEIIGGR